MRSRSLLRRLDRRAALQPSGFRVINLSPLVVFGLTIRPFPNWGWVLASGLVGIVLALILWANLPVTALWLIGVLLGLKPDQRGGGNRLSRLAGALELRRSHAFTGVNPSRMQKPHRSREPDRHCP